LAEDDEAHLKENGRFSATSAQLATVRGKSWESPSARPMTCH